MTIRNVSEAKSELSALLTLVESGEEVVIARAGKPIVKLVLIEGLTSPRRLGAMAGQIHIALDFDAPDSNFEDLFYEEGIEPSS